MANWEPWDIGQISPYFDGQIPLKYIKVTSPYRKILGQYMSVSTPLKPAGAAQLHEEDMHPTLGLIAVHFYQLPW
jgi:hypothetical protein